MTCVLICDRHDFSLNLAVFAENEDLILHFVFALDSQLSCTSQNKSPLGVWVVFGTAVKIRWSACHWLLSSTRHTVVRSRSICQKHSFIPQRAFLHVGASGWAEILPSYFQNVLLSYYSTTHPVTSHTCLSCSVSQPGHGVILQLQAGLNLSPEHLNFPSWLTSLLPVFLSSAC